MKRLLLALMALVAITVSNAQVVPVAILTSGDEVTTFYGKDALNHAHNAAKDGDVINLSTGAFTAIPDITKGITIIGSGMDQNNSEGYTRILGNFNTNLRHAQPSEFRLENLFFDGQIIQYNTGKVYLKRCSTGNFSKTQEASGGEIQASNCIFRGEFSTKAKSIIYNSEFKSYVFIDNSQIDHYFSHCVFSVGPDNSSCENCIFATGDWDHLPERTSATGCKYIGSLTDFFAKQDGENECVNAENVFKADTFYELSDEYAQKWLTKDGSQIGLYGGPEPFSLIPDGPRITKFNVASKTSADGKLSVDIEIENPKK